MTMAGVRRTKRVAPDGGWAWMVCLGVSMVNFSTRSLEPSFGLLFGDLLKDLGVETTGASFTMSMLDCMVNFSGFFVGPVIKTFSYRKVCFFGSFVSATALLITSPAASMAHLIATYSILGGIGVGFASASSFVSLNHFFSKKRGQAVGLSMAGTGIGLMVMPQLVRLLLEAYGFRGAVLVLGALAYHSVLGSCLLQPIEWHLKEEEIDEEMQIMQEMEKIEENDEEAEDRFEADALMATLKTVKPTIPRAATCERTLRDMERVAQGGGRLPKRPTMPSMPRIMSTASVTNNSHMVKKRRESVMSTLSHMDFNGSNLQIFLDPADDDLGINITPGRRTSVISRDKSVLNNNDIKQAEQNESFFKRFINLMDLDLLKDLSYLNLLFGLSIFWVGELNFRLLTPFFISNLGYSKTEVAFCLSMTAISDIMVRLVLPPIFDKRNVSKKFLFFVAAFFLVVTRSILAEQTEWIPLMVWLSICGLFRGVCLSNLTLTVSESCTLEKLPAAFGLHMVAKGLFVLILGPVVGAVRDYSGSYPVCIHFQNFFISLCVLAWTIEYVIKFFWKKKVIDIK